MTRILLVRHGETEWNAAGRVQGWTDSPLSDRGRAQAARLAARLAAFPLAAVYASDLSRARDTARALAAPHGLPVLDDPGLRERCYGDWEGLTLSELEARYPDAWDRYHRQRALDVLIPGGETWEEVAARVVPSCTGSSPTTPARRRLSPWSATAAPCAPPSWMRWPPRSPSCCACAWTMPP